MHTVLSRSPQPYAPHPPSFRRTCCAAGLATWQDSVPRSARQRVCRPCVAHTAGLAASGHSLLLALQLLLLAPRHARKAARLLAVGAGAAGAVWAVRRAALQAEAHALDWRRCWSWRRRRCLLLSCTPPQRVRAGQAPPLRLLRAPRARCSQPGMPLHSAAAASMRTSGWLLAAAGAASISVTCRPAARRPAFAAMACVV